MSLVCNFVKSILLCVMFLGAFVHSMYDFSIPLLLQKPDTFIEVLQEYNLSIVESLKCVNKQLYEAYQRSSKPNACKEALYKKALEIADTSDGAKILNKEDLLHNFSVYWNRYYKTLFLSEKLNKKDRELLQQIEKKENLGFDVPIAQYPKSSLYAIKYPEDCITQKYVPRNAHLETGEWPRFCEIPTFGSRTSTLSSEELDHRITICTAPGCYISYDPLRHDFPYTLGFTHYTVDIFTYGPRQTVHRIAAKIFDYPRIFKKFVSSPLVESEVSEDLLGNKGIYNYYQLDTFADMNPDYRKIIRENFLLRGEPIKKNDILVRLFTSHSGDERSPATTHCIASLYEKYQKKLGCTCSKDKYVKIVTKQFFKPPAEQKKQGL
jgi:hypothetical protein